MPAFLALALDVLLVVVFAALGRGSHQEALTATGVWQTAWPFLTGLAVGWAVVLLRRASPGSVGTGLLLWGCTWAIGMALRLATGAGTAPAFLVVAAVALGLLLLCWRVVGSLARRRRSSRAL